MAALIRHHSINLDTGIYSNKGVLHLRVFTVHAPLAIWLKVVINSRRQVEARNSISIFSKYISSPSLLYFDNIYSRLLSA
jgi:hypothetical protein